MDEEVHWDREVDVVCVGSGAGGLMAAATAADAGATVLLVEKDPELGGVTARSGGQLWMGATDQSVAAGLDDSLEDALAYLADMSHGLADAALRDTFVRRGIEAFRYMGEGLGIPLQLIRGIPDYWFPNYQGSKVDGRYLEVDPFEGASLGEWAQRCVTSPYDDIYSFLTFRELLASRGPLNNVDKTSSQSTLAATLTSRMQNDVRCMGAGLTGWLLKAGLDRGVEPMTSTRATRLLGSAAGVEGVVLQSGQTELRIRTRCGVLLAVGAYDWNRELMKEFEGLSESGSMTTTSVEGDHFAMAAEVGARPLQVRPPEVTPIFVGYAVPDQELNGQPLYRCWEPGPPHSIVVNRAGRRFADDGFYPEVVERLTGRDDQDEPNWPSWAIFDQEFLNHYGLPPFAPGEPIPASLAHVADDFVTLAELAGIDVDGLVTTVERFNTFAETGVDEDFARGSKPWSVTMLGDPEVVPNSLVAALENPPYYALELGRVSMGVPSAGLPYDVDANVLDGAGAPIPGLFVAGNSAAWNDVGGGYNSGMPNSRGLTWGYVAARAMTARQPAPLDADETSDNNDTNDTNDTNDNGRGAR